MAIFRNQPTIANSAILVPSAGVFAPFLDGSMEKGGTSPTTLNPKMANPIAWPRANQTICIPDRCCHCHLWPKDKRGSKIEFKLEMKNKKKWKKSQCRQCGVSWERID